MAKKKLSRKKPARKTPRKGILTPKEGILPDFQPTLDKANDFLDKAMWVLELATQAGVDIHISIGGNPAK
jgi:hypothetical protein